MSVSRASASRAVVAAVLVFGGLAAAPGAAQVAVPMSPSEQPPAPAPVPADVRIDRLTTVDVDSTGVLTAEQGGFGASMWRGTGRSVVEALLPRLPVDTGSRAMRDLMRRLLLSAAGAPEGEATPGSLVALRARMLLAMGDLGGVEALLAATSTRVADPDLAQIRVDALLLSGDNAGACAVAERRMDAAVAVYWQKVLIFCQALAGH